VWDENNSKYQETAAHTKHSGNAAQLSSRKRHGHFRDGQIRMVLLT
jgi:hypothetical protein